MDFFPRVSAWIQPVRPSFTLHQCGSCGLRHGWNICRARFSSCFKCGRGGHYARMCRTRNSGSVNAVSVSSNPAMRTIGTQTEGTLTKTQISKKKQKRDRERIKTFTKARKEKENSILSELPFSTVNVIEIRNEKLEIELEKFKELAANLKTESQFFRDKWIKERKRHTIRVKELQEELKMKTDTLEKAYSYQEDFYTALKEKEEEIRQIKEKHKETAQNQHISASGHMQFSSTRGNNRAHPKTSYNYPCPIYTPFTGSVSSNTKFYRKHEDVFRGARGKCHRAKRVNFE